MGTTLLERTATMTTVKSKHQLNYTCNISPNNTLHRDATQLNTIQHNTAQRNATQRNRTQYSTTEYNATQEHGSTQRYKTQRNAIPWRNITHWSTPWYNTTHRNVTP